METYLRAFDPNLARRRLHDILYITSSTIGVGRENLPHTFDTPALLGYAERFLRRRDVRLTEFHPELMERTGISMALCGRDEDAEKLFDRGLRGAAESRDEARFYYLRGHYLHFRRGELAQAKRVLERALVCTETQRHLKSEELLVLGRIARLTQDADGAEKAYRQVLTSGVLKYRPTAMQYLSILRRQQGRYDEAVKLNRKAHALMKRRRLTLAMMQADADLAAFHMAEGEYRLAKEILETVVARNVQLLDLNSAGNTYNNLAMALEKLGDLRGARDAYLQALRYETAMDRKLQQSTSYRNLGITLYRLGDIECGFAAFETAIRLSKEISSAEAEFRTRTEALEAIGRSKRRLECVPHTVGRCDELLDTCGNEISRDGLRSYSRVIGRVAARRNPDKLAGLQGRRSSRLAGPEGRAALKALTAEIVPDEFEKRLAQRIGAGLPGRCGPKPEELCSFLMLFSGDFFQFKNYSREFPLTPARVKHQLRELCRRKIIELSGTKKAAKYALAFHRS